MLRYFRARHRQQKGWLMKRRCVTCDSVASAHAFLASWERERDKRKCRVKTRFYHCIRENTPSLQWFYIFPILRADKTAEFWLLTRIWFLSCSASWRNWSSSLILFSLCDYLTPATGTRVDLWREYMQTLIFLNKEEGVLNIAGAPVWMRFNQTYVFNHISSLTYIPISWSFWGVCISWLLVKLK